jgi:MoaA/NifB/PqqE/SkfB family radical SAM enzyme
MLSAFAGRKYSNKKSPQMMKIKKPNPINHLLNFKKELWITDYSTRMQRFLGGEKLPPLRIDAEVHRRCNCSCLFCVRRRAGYDLSEESRALEIPIKRWLEIARESADMGVRMWNIAGIGEPMATPDGMLSLMRSVKKGRMFGELTSNGTLWTEKIASEAVRMQWDSINISIDAPTANIHNTLRQHDAFEKATAAVKMLNLYRIKYQLQVPCITINMVLNSLNYQELPGMVKLVAALGADALFVEPMIVYTKVGERLKLKSGQVRKLPGIIRKSQRLADALGVELFITCLDGDGELKKFNKNLVEKTGSIRNEIHVKKFDSKPRALIEKILDIPCYYPWFYLIITADGSVAHCGECDEKNLSIKDKTLKEIWYGIGMEQMRTAYLSGRLPKYCDRCRPNVIGELNLIRKSIREYGSLPNVQKKLVELFRENMWLFGQHYYLEKGVKPPSKKRSIFNRIRTYGP